MVLLWTEVVAACLQIVEHETMSRLRATNRSRQIIQIEHDLKN